MKINIPPYPPKSPTSKIINFKEARTRIQNPALGLVHDAFRRWMGSLYDIELLNIILSAAAASRLKGDPLWLMIVGGPGAGKTEAACTLESIDAHICSTINSEGALLSAAKKKKDATGGILRQIGSAGLLIIKDFTTILSMPDRASRPQILAALREIHDGRWVRNVGADGGQTLEWSGRIGVIAACTTAWDTAYSAIATMGDRFIVVRMNSRDKDIRLDAARQAMHNVGREHSMRSDLRSSVKGLLGSMSYGQVGEIPPDEVTEHLLIACEMASRARTPTDHDYHGKVTYSHDPESPTRLSKSLIQLIRGALAISIPIEDAFSMAMRCIRDSIPPLRLECLCDMADHSDCKIQQIASRIDRPWNAVDRALQALHSAGMISSQYREKEGAHSLDRRRGEWIYNIHSDVDISCLWPTIHIASPPLEDEVDDATKKSD